MKANAFCTMALALGISAGSAYAQTKSKPISKSIVKQETVVIQEKPGTEKTTIDIKNGKLFINGEEITGITPGPANATKTIVVEHNDRQSSTASGNNSIANNRAMLGVATRGDSNGESGAIIARVTPNSAAEKAGLHTGDRITKIDNESIPGPQALVDAIANYNAGEQVKITYERDGQQQATTATLDRALDRTSGIYRSRPGNRNFDFENDVINPFWFDIEQDVLGTTPKLGISAEDMADNSGVKVLEVKPGSIAAASGLQKDDIIYQLGRDEVSTIRDLQQSMRQLREGSTEKLKYERNGKTMTTEIKVPRTINKKDL